MASSLCSLATHSDNITEDNQKKKEKKNAYAFLLSSVDGSIDLNVPKVDKSIIIFSQNPYQKILNEENWISEEDSKNRQLHQYSTVSPSYVWPLRVFKAKDKRTPIFRQSIEIVPEKSKFGRRIIFTKDSSSSFGFANFIFDWAPKTD